MGRSTERQYVVREGVARSVCVLLEGHGCPTTDAVAAARIPSTVPPMVSPQPNWTGRVLRTARRPQVVIGASLAVGGEGSVHRIEGSAKFLAKLYHHPPSADRVAKLDILAGLPEVHRVRGVTAMPVAVLMVRGVTAQRQARDDHLPGLGYPLPEAPRAREAERGRMPGSDHRDAAQRQRGGIAADVEPERRILAQPVDRDRLIRRAGHQHPGQRGGDRSQSDLGLPASFLPRRHRDRGPLADQGLRQQDELLVAGGGQRVPPTELGRHAADRDRADAGMRDEGEDPTGKVHDEIVARSTWEASWMASPTCMDRCTQAGHGRPRSWSPTMDHLLSAIAVSLLFCAVFAMIAMAAMGDRS